MDLPFLDSYSGETTDDLIALEGKYRTDSLVLAFESSLTIKADDIGINNLSDAEKIILAVVSFEREVNNGGFNQFFFNSSNAFVPIFVESLKRINCNDAATLAKQAIDILQLKNPPSVAEIARVIDEEDEDRDEKLNKCDDQYYQSIGDISEQLFQFIKRNRNTIKLVS